MKLNTQEKLDYIFSELRKGVDREEIASRLGYKNYKSMDTFVRRQDYTWDGRRGKYLRPGERRSGRYSEAGQPVKGKPGSIISLFEKGEQNAKAIAQELGFDGNRDLAIYMTSKGYLWNDEVGNYELEVGGAGDVAASISVIDEDDELTSKVEVGDGSSSTPGQVKGDYQQLLDYLLEKEALLRELLDGKSAEEAGGSLPRYAVPGIFVTKSVHMTNQLDQMVRDFSKENNISQRELFEVALVEFFQKYGYRQELEILLGQK